MTAAERVCNGNTAACDGRDLLPVRLGLRAASSLWCGACRATAIAMGTHVRVVERRVADVPVTENRRRPAWLRRLTARDDTGRMTAA